MTNLFALPFCGNRRTLSGGKEALGEPSPLSNFALIHMTEISPLLWQNVPNGTRTVPSSSSSNHEVTLVIVLLWLCSCLPESVKTPSVPHLFGNAFVLDELPGVAG